MIKTCSLADNSPISSGGNGGSTATNIPDHIYIDNSFDPDHLPVGNIPLLQLLEISAYNGAANVPVTIEDSAAPTTSADLTTPSAHPTNNTYVGNIVVIPAGTMIIEWNRCVLFGSAEIINATGGVIEGYLAGTQVFSAALPNNGAGSTATYVADPVKIDQLRLVVTNPIGLAKINWQEPETKIDIEQFDQYIVGETTFGAERWESNSNVAMIIDSAAPPIPALGTPNASVGGPGVGAGTGNIHNRGKVIAITNGNTTSITIFSGAISWYPFAPISMCSAGIINANGGTINLYRDGSIVHTRAIPDGGTNGYQLIKINYSGTTDRVEFVLQNAAAISGINYYGRAVPDYGFIQTETFSSFREAEPTAETNQWLSTNTAIVDTGGTIIPTQWRTPHVDFGGAGVGAGGQAGPTQNNILRGKGIINTASHETLIPDTGSYNIIFRGNTIVTKLIFVGGNAGTVDIGGTTYNIAEFEPNAVKELNVYARGNITINSANVLVELQYTIYTSVGICTGVHSISDVSGLQTQIDALQLQINNKPDNLPDLNDVTITAPAANQVLTYQGPNWVNAAITNLYTADDALTNNRVVTMGANSLTFTGSGNMNFNSSGNYNFAGPIILNAVAEFVQTGTNYRLSNVNTTLGATTTLHQGGSGAAAEAIILTNTAAGPSITFPNIDQFTAAAPTYYLSTDNAGLVQRSDISALPNLYTADGTLAANREVTMGANSLTFTGSGNMNFNSTGATNFNNTLTFNAIGSIRQETTNLTINQETAAAGSTFALRVGGLLAANTAVELENHSSGFAQVRLPNLNNFVENSPTNYVTVDASGNLETSPIVNLYTADGTLAANRAVTMGANSLTFTGSGATNFNSTGATNFNNVVTFNAVANLLETGNDFDIQHLNNTVAAGMSLYAGGNAADNHGIRIEVGTNDEGNITKVILPNLFNYVDSSPNNYVTIDGSGVLYSTAATNLPTIYNANGTIGAARTVTLNDNINFAGTGDFNIATTGTVSVAGEMNFGATGNLRRENSNQDFAISGTDNTTGSALILRSGGLNAANEGIKLINDVSGFANIQFPNLSNYVDNSAAYYLSCDISGNVTRTDAGSLPNIYTADGTLSADRTINQADNNLTFTNAHIGVGFADTTTALSITNTSGAATNLMLTGGAGDPGFPNDPPDVQLITFAFNGTSSFRHRIQSVHNATNSFMGNRILFSIWDPEDNTTSTQLGAKRAFTIGDDYIMFNDYTPAKSHDASVNTGATWKNLQITQTGFVITADVPVITANLDLANNRAINAADPVLAQDLVTLNYLNNNPVNIYTTDGTISGTRTINMSASNINFVGTGLVNFNNAAVAIKSNIATDVNLNVGDGAVSGRSAARFRCGESSGLGFNVVPALNQIKFGFGNTDDFNHHIFTQHDAGLTHMKNNISFAIWNGGASTDPPPNVNFVISDFIAAPEYTTDNKLQNTGGTGVATNRLGTDADGKIVQLSLNNPWAQLEFNGLNITYAPLTATPTKIQSTNEVFSGLNFSRSADGTIRYDGAVTRVFKISATIVMVNDDATNTRTFRLRIDKNGAAAYDPNGQSVAAGNPAKIDTHYILSLAQNDTISCSFYLGGIGLNARIVDYNYAITAV